MEFTEKQREAVYTLDRNIVVVAGAGSGKTRVLVERFLNLLNENPDWPLTALVAITFTRKAAEEMRARVRLGLENLYLQNALSANRDRIADLLTQIDTARIDTIHGLCASILRTNAARAGLDPQFVVLDEVEAAALSMDAVDETLTQLARSAAPELALIEEYGLNAVKDALIKGLAFDLPEEPLSLEAVHEVYINDFRLAIRRLVHNAPDLNFGDLPGDDKLAIQIEDMVDLLNQLSDDSQDINRLLDLLANLADLNLRTGSNKNWEAAGNFRFEEARAARKKLRDGAKAIYEHFSTITELSYLDVSAVEYAGLWHQLIMRARQTLMLMKQRLNALDFDDLERMTRDLLINNADVRARYRGKEFKHLLVDEFQDTNQRQWDIVRSLADVEVAGSLFVVGDEKQSIYAFRGADVSVFGEVRRIMQERGGHEIAMVTSFRTHADLVREFNAVFDRLLVRDVASPVASYQVTLGEPMLANRAVAPGDGPALRAILALKPDSADEDEESDLSAREIEADAIARHIRDMVESWVPVHAGDDKVRPVRYGDFAVLLQALTNVGVYEEALKLAGIPYVTVSGRGYYDRQEVWDVLNVLRAVYDPADNLALASALRSPLFNFSDDALFALRYKPEDGSRDHIQFLWQSVQDPPGWFPTDELGTLSFAAQALLDFRGYAGRMMIWDLLNLILERTGYLAVLSALPDGNRKRGNVEKLLAKARSSGKVTLGEFSRYLKDLSDREVRESEAVVEVSDVVQIMSVHASKGLEFPVVIVADASYQRLGGSDLLAFDERIGLYCKVYDEEGKEQKAVLPPIYKSAKKFGDEREAAEKLRLLYVACTRASDYLVISGSVTIKNDGTFSSAGWLKQLVNYWELVTDPLPDGLYNGVHVNVSEAVYLRENTIDSDETQTGWDLDLAAIDPLKPDLLDEIIISRSDQVRHLAATHIEDIGGVIETHDILRRKDFAQRLRRSVFHDAPHLVRNFPTEAHSPSARQIGEIVHEALRNNQTPRSLEYETLRQMLVTYAWRNHITDREALDWTVEQSLKLLHAYDRSPIFDWIDAAQTVYRELPFVMEFDGYVIHGIIDVLLQTADGRWLIIDFKTGYVPDDEQEFRSVARQYYLQMGLYALAVQRQLGTIEPEAYLHFIRRANHPIRVKTEAWREVLEVRLAHRIRDILEDTLS